MFIENERLMTTTEAAEYLKSQKFIGTKNSLEVMRCKNYGPKYKKIGRRVFYEKEWLDEYIANADIQIFEPSRGGA